MTKQQHLRSAGSAIAAALVLSANPTFAQDAAAPESPPITIVVPEPASAPAPVPAAQIETPAATTAQADLGPAEPAAQAPVQRAAPRDRTAVAPRAAVSAIPIAVAADSARAAQTVADAAPAAVGPAAVEAAPIQDATSEAGSGDGALLAGLLAALGLGGLALAFTRRRRAKRVAVLRDTAPIVAAPEPAPAPIAQRAPAMRWTSPAAFAIPAVVPDDMQARRELIERMVTAQPDAANPFKSRKARTRRARLILAYRVSNQRPPIEDRVVARPAEPTPTDPQREFERA